MQMKKTKDDLLRTLRMPQIAVGAVIIDRDNVLLVKRKNPPAENQWAIPGGKVKWGETLEQALIREIREETHLEIEVNRFLKTIEIISKNSAGEIDFHYVILDYLARVKQGIAKADDDALEVRWFKKSELKNFPVTKTTRALLEELAF